MPRPTHLSAPPRLWDEISSDLLSTPHLERAGIGFAGIADGHGAQRLLLRDWAPVPSDEYQVQLSNHLEVDPTFYARASKRARASGEALVILHSHPSDWTVPRFSGSDDFGEDRLIPKIQARAQVPVGAVVLSPGGWAARITDAKGRRGSLVVAEMMSFAPALPATRIAQFDRQARALGDIGHSQLAALKVGVVGAGGIGSHVTAQLAHIGVGEVVAIDFDRVDVSNLSRLVGATRLDAMLRRRKTSVVRRVARRLRSGTRVTSLVVSVTDAAGAIPLLDCDVVFGCTDNHWSRMVLSALAYQFHVPVVDTGVEIQPGGASGGRVSWLYPGSACLWCLGVLDAERIRVEQLPEATRRDEEKRGYVQGSNDPAPAVVSINGAIASLAVTELLARVTGFAGDTHNRADQLVYRLREGDVRRVSVSSRPDCMWCNRTGLQGTGNLAPVPWNSLD